MYGEFVWWQGVVEDRLDPLKLGRCRVRVLGYHTDNKEDGVGIPTADLPWATPSQPITSAAMNGVGTTPLGPVEGTWVFGFFRDGKNAQEPVIIGTFGGIPEDGSNPTLGFNDPNGKYPLQTNLKEADTNRLARGAPPFPVPIPLTEEELKDPVTYPRTSEDSPSLIQKRKARQKDTPTALAGDISTSITNTSNSALYVSTLWNEPNPRYGGTGDSDIEYLSSVEMPSSYPFNHVRMGESGHVEEWDDTPTAERLHKFHKTGTFEEIQPDGTKVTKIVGNEYEITLKNKKVLIKGTCDVTIEGDCRMLYKKDLVQHVEGDYHLHVQGDKRTKIHGNEVTEVLADRKVVIGKEGAGNDDLFVNLQQTININQDRTINIGGTLSETIKGDVNKIYLSNLLTGVGQSVTLFSVTSIDIVGLSNIGISSNANIDITSTANMTQTVGASYRKKVTGSAFEQYISTLDERHEGHYKLYTGDDTSVVAITGKVDNVCPTSRTGTTTCNPAAGA